MGTVVLEARARGLIKEFCVCVRTYNVITSVLCVAFGTQSDLTKHIKVVHEKRRDHACGYCDGVAFGTAGTLKAHISAVHLKIKRSRGAK